MESPDFLAEIYVSIKNLSNMIDNYNEFCEQIDDENKNKYLYLFDKCKKSLNEHEIDEFDKFIATSLSFNNEFLLEKKRLISIPSYLEKTSDENQQLNQETQKLQEENQKLASLISDNNPENKNHFNQENHELKREIENLKNQILKLQSNQQQQSDGKDYKTLYLELYQVVENTMKKYSQMKVENESYKLLVNKDQEIQKLNDAIAEKDQRIQTDDDKISSLTKTLEEKNSLIQKQNDEIQELKKTIDSLRREIDEKNSLIQKQNDENKRLNEAISSLRREIDEKNSLIQKLNDENRNLKDEIKRLNDIIKSLQKEIEEKNLLIQKLKDEIRNLKDEIKKLNDIIKSLQNEIEEKNSLVQKLNNDNHKLNDTIILLRKEKDEKEKLILSFEKTKKELTKIIKGQKEIINKQMILAKNENERQISRIGRMQNSEINAILESFS